MTPTMIIIMMIIIFIIMIVIILIIEIIYYNYNYTREARDPRRKAFFLCLPFSLPLTSPNQPLRQPHSDPHPIVSFPFLSLSRFLPQFDGQTDLSHIIV